jgi:FAD/FMN-containing dehydrogenase
MAGKVERRSVLKGLAGAGVVASLSQLLVACDGHGRALSPETKQALNDAVQGDVYWKGDTSYEMARGRAAYRANKPKRYPQVIVLPETDKDVIAAVKFARQHDLKVTTRSGGHSWSSAHIRDGVLMIDISKMQEISINAASKTLWVNPGVIGSTINAALKNYDLIIPTAHHPSPGIGGFSMSGGFGWNSRLWGNGARQVIAIDVVTADGDLIRCDKSRNSDFWWAARGGGAGFFGVITRMQIQAHARPKVWKASVLSFDDAHDVFDELMAWACDLVPHIPPYMEMVMTTTANSRDTGDPVRTRITAAALVLTDDEAEADRALGLFDTCPVKGKANFTVDKAPTTLDERYASGFKADPAGFRFAADNFYTDAPTEQLVPRLRKVFLDLPSPHTHTFWFAWGPITPFPNDMALSMQGPIYVGTYTLWKDPAQDAAMEAWPPARMKELDDISLGGQLNDENMLHHPQRYFTPEAYTKLERLRQQHDPQGRFEGFLGKPMPA